MASNLIKYEAGTMVQTANGDMVFCVDTFSRAIRATKPTERTRFYVMFSFGSFATVGVKMEEGRSIAENLKARSADIIAYLDEATGQFITI